MRNGNRKLSCCNAILVTSIGLISGNAWQTLNV